jgi:hypothetical protein
MPYRDRIATSGWFASSGNFDLYADQVAVAEFSAVPGYNPSEVCRCRLKLLGADALDSCGPAPDVCKTEDSHRLY